MHSGSHIASIIRVGVSSHQSIVGKQIIVNFVIGSSLSLDDGGWVDVDGGGGWGEGGGCGGFGDRG